MVVCNILILFNVKHEYDCNCMMTSIAVHRAIRTWTVRRQEPNMYIEKTLLTVGTFVCDCDELRI